MLLDRLSKTGSLSPAAPWAVDNLVQLELPSSRDSPRIAREAVVAACRRWGLSAEVAHAAELVTSELVTNAVIHAGTPLVLAAEHEEPHLTVAVSDGESSFPSLRPPSHDREDGRGIAIIDRLGATWGVQRTILGKTVWVSLVVAGG
jgi:anti-sigma regulatory factor (Ser/Thr protein kinase)